MSGQKLGIIVVCVGLLILLGSVYQVGAAPPEPEKGSVSLPDPTSSPVTNILTRLQPYQLPGSEPAQSTGRMLQQPSSLPGANTKPAQQIPLNPAEVSALAQQTFYAIADATVLQGYPTVNTGDTIDMWAGYDDSLTPDGRIVRSLIKFNIASLPPGQIITKATLRVRLINSWDYPNTYRTITTYRITANWSESGVTWNNAPGYGSSYGSKSIRNDDLNWHEFDVTDLAASWYNGTYPNHGVMLRGPEISGLDSSWRAFGTREGPFTPELIIEYQTLPIAPTNLTATAVSTSQINLLWEDNSNNETGFKIERSPDGSNWTQIGTVGANVITYANTNLICGTTYFYQVRAYNIVGDSDPSNTDNATTFVCPQPPAQPTNLTATAVSTSQINLLWKDNSSNETGFKIERSPDGSNWTQIDTVGANVITYANTNLICNKTYFYQVRAYNAVGGSAPSNPDNATTFECPSALVKPTNLTATAVSASQINLAWQDNSNNEGGFKIERSPDGINGWAEIGAVEANITTYADTSLPCHTSYSYQVRAFNTAGNSDYSNTANATTFVCIYLPIIIKEPAPTPLPTVTPTPTATPGPFTPADGHWTGTTNLNQPMSFDVSGGGTSVSNFKLKTSFSVGGCSGTVETTVSSPIPISSNQFSRSSGTFSFSGQFTSANAANGTYAFTNHSIPGCGSFSQSGTWTANKP